MNVHVEGAPAEESDMDGIVELVAAVQNAQQNELPGEFMELFRKDAVWTTALGKRLTGWEEINAFTHRVLPGAMRESTATYQVARIQFIRPDVAAVNVRQRPVTLDGGPFDGQPPGSPLYVLAKDGGQWRIGAAQNTQITDPETLATG